MKFAEALFGLDKLSFSVNHKSPVIGRVLFLQEAKNKPVQVRVALLNVPDGLHGFHVHQKPITSSILKTNGNCCALLEGHFGGNQPNWSPTNPTGVKHGHHVGDLCFNLKAKNNRVNYEFIDYKVSLYSSSPNCILNRSLILHKDPDDCGLGTGNKQQESWITGNAGTRIACANINEITY